MNRRERHRRHVGGMVALVLLASAIGTTSGTRPSAADDVLGLVRLDAPGGTPSSICQTDNGQQIADLTTQGVHVKVYVNYGLPGASTVGAAVCYRIDAPDGTGVGGRIAILPAAPDVDITGVGVPTIGVPSTDTNSTACSTTTPNGVPGTHPISSGSVLGVPYMIDAYSGPTGSWVCIQLPNTVSTRVVVPTTSPITGTPDVTVTPAYVVTISRDAS